MDNEINKHQPDTNGISRSMVDKMVDTFAEGFATGSTDIRDLLYCAYRNARNIQKFDVERFVLIEGESDA
jgi:hypothetical protein